MAGGIAVCGGCGAVGCGSALGADSSAFRDLVIVSSITRWCASSASILSFFTPEACALSWRTLTSTSSLHFSCASAIETLRAVGAVLRLYFVSQAALAVAISASVGIAAACAKAIEDTRERTRTRVFVNMWSSCGPSRTVCRGERFSQPRRCLCQTDSEPLRIGLLSSVHLLAHLLEVLRSAGGDLRIRCGSSTRWTCRETTCRLHDV